MVNIAIIVIPAVLIILVLGIFIFKKKNAGRDYLLLEEEICELKTYALSLDNSYISNNDASKFIKAYGPIINKLKHLKMFLESSKQNDVNQILSLYLRVTSNLEHHNAEFVKAEKDRYTIFFSNIDGKTLDDQQQTAVITNQDNNLVVAGAGSGKTLTIAGKVKYLCEKKNVNPEDILLITFTRKASEEMSERIGKMGIHINAMTFHKLGLDIIKSANKSRPDIFDEKEFRLFMEDYFTSKVLSNDDVMKSLILFFSYYLNIPADIEKHKSIGEAYEAERTSDLETLRGKYFDKKQEEYLPDKRTLHGEFVKSLEELTIANFLFLNGINYEYEKLYPFDTGDPYRKQYRPDFYLPEYDIYLEHFGVNEHNKCPWLSEIEEEKYIEGMSWKRQLHKANRTKLIESYSWYNSKGCLEQKLRELLINNNVEFTNPDYRDLYNKAYNDVGDKAFKHFIQLCTTFISLYKANGYKPDDISRLKYPRDSRNTPFYNERTVHFKTIIKPIICEYEKELKASGKVDFSDMINQAADLIKAGSVGLQYKYIIIDEFQDISMAKCNLVKAIRDETDAKIFAVGDDWQSIYRFAGSDISIFTRFSNYFGTSEIMRIEKTYRNSQELIDVASSFIMKNPEQIKKDLTSDKHIDNPVVIYFDASLKNAISNAISSIIDEFGTDHSIMLLGRTKYDYDTVRESGLFKRKNDKLIYIKNEKLNVFFLTAHRSKGLEADNVIILNFNNSRLGFPNKIVDDPILELVLNQSDQFDYAEERRLLYVALTRTRNKVYLLSDGSHPSEFVHDFEDEDNVLMRNRTSYPSELSCPLCQTGKLIPRRNQFIGCTNYPQCNYTIRHLEVLRKPIICKCGGFMIKRNGKNGVFLGCSNYPYCTRTIDNPEA